MESPDVEHGRVYLNVIENMYNKAKSCISANGKKSNYFPCTIGVRQGENLSPLLFSLFLNDLHSFFANKNNINGINLTKRSRDDKITEFLKLFVLLYADDTVLITESAKDLQHSLNVYEDYCNTWNLTVNTSKTKVLIFSSGRQVNFNFTYKNETVDIVDEYKYLGIMFGRSGSFLKAKAHLANQATRAMYSLLKKTKDLFLPIDLQIQLYEKTVKPILLYGCECWGHGNINVLEKVQLKYLKHILGLKSSTPNCIVYGETGIKPLSIDIDARIITFWSKLVNPTHAKLPPLIYNIALSNYINSPESRKSKYFWINYVKNILIKCGHINIWESHLFPNNKWLQLNVKQKLSDLFINEWLSILNTSNKCQNYRIFKNTFGFETYLINTPHIFLKYVIKFRTRNNRLPVELSSWNRNNTQSKQCPLCNLNNSIGDEFHYLLECNSFNSERKRFIDNIFYKRPNIHLFKSLMNINTSNFVKYRKLCTFIKAIINKFKR